MTHFGQTQMAMAQEYCTNEQTHKIGKLYIYIYMYNYIYIYTQITVNIIYIYIDWQYEVSSGHAISGARIGSVHLWSWTIADTLTTP